MGSLDVAAPARLKPLKKWRGSLEARRAFCGVLVLCATVGFLGEAFHGYSRFTSSDEASAPAGRQLMEGGVVLVPGLNGKCEWECETQGRCASFAALFIAICVFIFLGVAIICDGHFTASLEMICSDKGLDLNNDVAGATFMAAGSSAPELATSFVGTFLSESNVGVGTIIGSAVFNILVIIGATAILSKEALDLDWRPVVRDNFFYLMSVLLLIFVIKQNGTDDIVTSDACILLGWYTTYILYMAINERMINKFCPYAEEVDSDSDSDDSDLESKGGSGRGSGSGSTEYDGIGLKHSNMGGEAPKKKKKKKSAPMMHSSIWQDTVDEQESKLDEADGLADTSSDDDDPDDELPSDDDSDDDDEESEGCMACLDKVNEVLSLPWELLFGYTMPDCAYPFELIDSIQDKIDDKKYWADKGSEEQAKRKKAKQQQLDKLTSRPLTCGQKWFWGTFFISLVHITWMSYFMVELMVKTGCIMGISDTVMGLTFLAMGTSIPDALGSLAVANRGEGDMAVSNAVGSNVFDICIGLGLPWFCKCMSVETENYSIPIGETDTIFSSTLILIGVIVLLFTTFAMSGWKLKPKVGYILLGAYGLFVVYSLASKSMHGGEGGGE